MLIIAFVLCACITDNSTLLDYDIITSVVQRGWNPLSASSARLEAMNDAVIKGCMNKKKNKLQRIWACHLLSVHSWVVIPVVCAHTWIHTSSEIPSYAIVLYFLLYICIILCPLFVILSGDQFVLSLLASLSPVHRRQNQRMNSTNMFIL